MFFDLLCSLLGAPLLLDGLEPFIYRKRVIIITMPILMNRVPKHICTGLLRFLLILLVIIVSLPLTTIIAPYVHDHDFPS